MEDNLRIILLPCAGGFPHVTYMERLISIFPSRMVLPVFQTKQQSTFGLERRKPSRTQITDAVINHMERNRNARFILVGWSMGGKIAIDLADMYPRLVVGMLLLAPSATVSRNIEICNRISVMIIHNINDKVVAIQSSRQLLSVFQNGTLLSYNGKDNHSVNKHVDEGINFVLGLMSV